MAGEHSHGTSSLLRKAGGSQGASEQPDGRGRRGVPIALFSLFLLASAYLGIGGYAGAKLTHGNHRPIDISAASVDPHFEDVAFDSRDHLRLRGWLFHSTVPVPAGLRSRPVVVVVHGYTQNRIDHDFDQVGFAEDLLRRGYDALLFDLRSSGQSEGDRVTFGTREPNDLLGAYDLLRGMAYRAADIAILGISMGAATTIEAAPRMPGVGALVIDSSFARLRPLLDRELRRNSLPGLFNPAVYLLSPAFGLDSDLRPIEVVRSMPDRAFLFFHGGADVYVPTQDSRDLRRASDNSASDLVIIASATHVHGWKTDPITYRNHFYPFVLSQLEDRGG